jgi:hypothetical protein
MVSLLVLLPVVPVLPLFMPEVPVESEPVLEPLMLFLLWDIFVSPWLAIFALHGPGRCKACAIAEETG